MKKAWMLGGVLFFTHPVWAQSGNQNKFSFLYYAGIFGGANINSATVDQATRLQVIASYHITPGMDFDNNQTRVMGQVQLGVGWRNERFYLGAELLG